MKRKVLTKKFFQRPTLEVARDLLGKFLVCKGIGNRALTCSAMITEVEAYDGFDDKASHASRGRTERNASMFDCGGVFYVYLCYGMYNMLNIVTGDKNYPAAILIRGVVVLPLLSEEGQGVVLDGPGKLTKFLNITRDFDGKAATKNTGLWFENRGIEIIPKDIKKTPRIGVAYAGPVWSKKPYRFLLKDIGFLTKTKK